MVEPDLNILTTPEKPVLGTNVFNDLKNKMLISPENW